MLADRRTRQIADSSTGEMSQFDRLTLPPFSTAEWYLTLDHLEDLELEQRMWHSQHTLQDLLLSQQGGMTVSMSTKKKVVGRDPLCSCIAPTV
jgi:hypothetical protein